MLKLRFLSFYRLELSKPTRILDSSPNLCLELTIALGFAGSLKRRLNADFKQNALYI